MSNVYAQKASFKQVVLYSNRTLNPVTVIKPSMAQGIIYGAGLRVPILSHWRLFSMNYQKNYDDYISYVKTLNRSKLKRTDPNYVYYEWHHVVPKCMGGKDDFDNLVLLTAREHYLAHYLLTKIYPKNVRVGFAFAQMHWGKSEERYGKVLNSKLFDANKNGVAYFNSIRVWTDEARRKIGDANRGHTWTMSLDGRNKISQALKGVPKSESHKKNVSLSKMGKPSYERTPEHNEYMSKILTGRVFSESHCKNISLSKEGRPFPKDVHPKRIQVEHNGVIYPSTLEAARSIGVSGTCITTALREGYKVKGFPIRRVYVS